MDSIEVLIVEDQTLVAESIGAMLEKHNLTVAAMCRSGEDAIRFCEQTTPDLVLMDIELAGDMDGISTAEIIHQRTGIPVIYLSDYTDTKTVNRAKKTLPANYISKPFNEVDLIRAIDIAFYNYKVKQQERGSSLLEGFIFVRTDNQAYQKLAYADILYLKADRAYCHLVTEKQTLILSTSMNHIQEQLAQKIFIKVHRSYVVNINKITAIEGRQIHIGKHRIQMNEEAHAELLKGLKLIK
ncbi:MAG TPA: response regulator [Cyclobacteriaceae bacterium]|nr:response regulator [Cyclobacteriaceae bacterium]